MHAGRLRAACCSLPYRRQLCNRRQAGSARPARSARSVVRAAVANPAADGPLEPQQPAKGEKRNARKRDLTLKQRYNEVLDFVYEKYYGFWAAVSKLPPVAALLAAWGKARQHPPVPGGHNTLW